MQIPTSRSINLSAVKYRYESSQQIVQGTLGYHWYSHHYHCSHHLSVLLRGIIWSCGNILGILDNIFAKMAIRSHGEIHDSQIEINWEKIKKKLWTNLKNAWGSYWHVLGVSYWIKQQFFHKWVERVSYIS